MKEFSPFAATLITVAALSSTSPLQAQNAGQTAIRTCGDAVRYDVQRRYRANQVLVLTAAQRRLSAIETGVSGRGSFDNRASFTYDCRYNLRTGAANGVTIQTNAQPVRPIAPPVASGGTLIRFPPRASETTLRGAVRGRDEQRYILRARAGQTTRLNLNSGNRAVLFTVTAPNGRLLYDGKARDRAFTGRLPSTGDYRISISLPRAEARRDVSAPYNLVVRLR